MYGFQVKIETKRINCFLRVELNLFVRHYYRSVTTALKNTHTGKMALILFVTLLFSCKENILFDLSALEKSDRTLIQETLMTSQNVTW